MTESTNKTVMTPEEFRVAWFKAYNEYWDSKIAPIQNEFLNLKTISMREYSVLADVIAAGAVAHARSRMKGVTTS